MSEDLKTRVNNALDQIRPAIESDGGDIELVDIRDNIVYVSLHGACVNCPASQMTLKAVVERVIKELVPEVESVEMEKC